MQKEKVFDQKYSKRSREAEALRCHLIEKKNEKIMMIQNRKKIQDRENVIKMEKLGAKLLQSKSPQIEQVKKQTQDLEDDILSQSSEDKVLDEPQKQKAKLQNRNLVDEVTKQISSIERKLEQAEIKRKSNLERF